MFVSTSSYHRLFEECSFFKECSAEPPIYQSAMLRKYLLSLYVINLILTLSAHLIVFVILHAAPVLSILEKIRIDAANNSALIDDALDEKKRKRASSIDILIQSSLYLSMTSRDSLTSEDEGEGDSEAKENENDTENDNTPSERGREKDQDKEKKGVSDLYTTISKHQNHAPFFRSHSPTASDGSTVTSSESRSINISDSDADSSVYDDTLSVMVTAAAAAHKAQALSMQIQHKPNGHIHSNTHPHPNHQINRLRDSNNNNNSNNNNSNDSSNGYLQSFSTTTTSLSSEGYDTRTHTHSSDMHSSSSLSSEQNNNSNSNPLHLFSSGFSELLPEPLPRTRRSNRPRASTFSVSSSHGHSNPQSLFDTEAERTPLGMITWLASLEDDDFVAAKMLAEFSNKDNDSSVEYNQCDIPSYRGTRSKDFSCSSSASPSAPTPAATSMSATAAAMSRNYHRLGGRDSLEPPSQRRRRANSVIEVATALYYTALLLLHHCAVL